MIIGYLSLFPFIYHHISCRYFLFKDKSAHNEIRDFYAHMALTHERRFARCFCRYSGNIASDISGIIKNLYHHPSWNVVQIFYVLRSALFII